MSAAEKILDGIPKGTPLATITITLPTNRWAILILPDGMTSSEIRHLTTELTSLLGTLDGLRQKAEQYEREDPASAVRQPWGEPR